MEHLDPGLNDFSVCPPPPKRIEIQLVSMLLACDAAIAALTLKMISRPPQPVFFHDDDASAILHDPDPFPRFNANQIEMWQSRTYKANGNGVVAQQRRWQTCSVVGSSGSLLHHKHGKVIDAADAVFRVNTAPTIGFEAHVGRRTTLRLWGGRRLPVDHGWTGDNASIVVFCQPVTFMSPCWRRIASEQPAPLRRLTPRLWHEARASMRQVLPASVTISRGKYPSTGAMAIFVALRLCSSVRIFGFGNESHPWNCPVPHRQASQPTCGRYFRSDAFGHVLSRSVRHSCGKWWRYAEYLRDSAPFHDLSMELNWVAQLVHNTTVVGSRSESCEKTAR